MQKEKLKESKERIYLSRINNYIYIISNVNLERV